VGQGSTAIAITFIFGRKGMKPNAERLFTGQESAYCQGRENEERKP
jgi:hypothetical protein